MHPEQIMRRIQQTIVGLGAIAGGCAALIWLLSSNPSFDQMLSVFESQASADEPVTAEAVPEVAVQDVDVVPSVTAPPVIERPLLPKANSIDSKALINDLDVTRDTDLAPKTQVVIPPGRPDWVEADFSHEKGDLQRVAVSSGPYFKKHEALRALDQELIKATQAFVADYLGHRAAGTLVPVDIDYIRRELVRPENIYHEQIEVSLGRPFISHALLEFTPAFRQELDERWRSIVVTGRVAKLGVIAVGVLLALSAILGYFKADNATRGYYTTRLQVGTAGAILALVAGGFVLFRLI